MESNLTSLLATIMRETKAKKSAKAYSYLRFSTAEQMSGDSFRRQTDLAKRYADQHGLTLDEDLTYRDLGVSGYSGANAKSGALAEFLEAVRKKVVPSGSYLLVENLDRLSRQTARKALRTLEDIIDAGITVVTLMDGRTYTRESLDNDGISLLIAILTMMRAHEESATKQHRAKAAWKAALGKASKGESRGASASPAWIRPTTDGKAWELIPERAATVRRIFEMAKAGTGKDSIAKRLNSESVPTFGAPRWWGSYIYRILNNRAAIGEHTPHEKSSDPETGAITRAPLKTIKGYYPAAVQKRLWNDVEALQGSSPRRGKHASAHVANVLGGLALCPSCGGKMVRKTPGSGPRSWPCLVCSAAKAGVKDAQGKPVCTYRSVGYQRVEDALVANIGKLASDAPSSSSSGKKLDANAAKLRSNLEAIEDQLENLLEHAAKAKVALPSALVERIRELEEARAAARKEVEAVEVQRRGQDKSMVDARLSEMEAAASKLSKAKGDDAAAYRTALNSSLRRLFVGVVVDYQTGELRFQWRHAPERESAVVYAWAEE